MNLPYVKQYDESGILEHPIKGDYLTRFPNRIERRNHYKKQRFCGNGQNFHLSLVGKLKYFRREQLIILKDENGQPIGKTKRVLHYDLNYKKIRTNK